MTSQPERAGNLPPERETKRLVALVLLWLASALTYTVLLVSPYGLVAHVATPRLSLPLLANRQPRAAALFLLCFLIAFALYALAYRLCRDLRSRRAVVVCIVLGALFALLLAWAYPIGATDVFDYIVQGQQLVLAQLNPLTVPAAAAPNLPLIRYAAYSRAISPYGPIWIWLQALLVEVGSGGGLLELVLAFKALAILGYLLTSVLIAAVLGLRRASDEPGKAAAGLLAFAWNPLVLYEVAVNAHNDIWLAALVLAAVFFWQRRRPLLVLVALTLALLIKAVVLPLLPLFALAAWRRERPTARMRLAIAGALTVAALTFAPYVLLPNGLQGMAALLKRTELFTHSLPAAVMYSLATVIPQPRATVVVSAATTLVFAAYTLLQLRNAWRRPDETVRLAFNLMLFLMLVCMPWFQPWYLVPVMALAAVYPRSDAPFQAALSTACVVASYIVYGFVWFWSPLFSGKYLGITLLAVLTSYLIPWTYAVLSGVRGKRRANLRDQQPRI